jgi:hypothetical protein
MQLAIETRKAYRELAEKIERGDTLDVIERRIVATILREAAGAISTVKPKREGHQPQVDPLTVALRYGWLCHHEGLGYNAAVERLAQEHDASETTIKKIVRQYREWAAAQFAGPRGAYRKSR